MSDKFKKMLDEVDQKVADIKAVQKVHTAKEKRIQKILDEQKKKENVQKAEEARAVKKGKIESQIMYALMIGGAGFLYLYPKWRKDPVSFWLTIIIIICSAGRVAIQRNNLR